MSFATILQRLVNIVPFRFRDNIKNIPGIKQLQAYFIKRYLDNKEFIATISGGPAKGLVFPVKLPQDKQMWIGTWELAFAKALQQAIKSNWICYDIGGYKGYYAGVMALNGAAKVYIFEPMPINIKAINNLISLNPLLPMTLMEVAVADKNGQAVFKIMPEETMGKLTASNFQQSDKELSQIEVQTVSLDSLVASGIQAPDFIKIDVEGAEEFVLEGAQHILKEYRPYLMIEIHSPEIGKSCLAILSQYYTSITVLETGLSPQEGTPDICHYIAIP